MPQSCNVLSLEGIVLKTCSLPGPILLVRIHNKALQFTFSKFKCLEFRVMVEGYPERFYDKLLLNAADIPVESLDCYDLSYS